MKSKFDKCIEEIMSTASVGVGSDKSETSVDPINDDFYARGDARIPNPPKRKKKKKCKTKHVKESVFSYPLKIEDSFKLLKGKFKDQGFDFKTATSVKLSKLQKLMSLKSQIVTDVLSPSVQWLNSQSKVSKDTNTFNFKNIMKSIEPHFKSDKILVIGSFVKNGKMGITWTMV